MNVVEAHHLGKRFGRTWALRDCRVSVPDGRVTALVGPNGAGKSTLLNLVAGLSDPTEGDLTVLGGLPPGSPAALAEIAYVAQDAPLYPNLSVADTVHLASCLNLRFDTAGALQRIGELDIPLDRRVGKLSGGQHVQVALAVTLARHPKLLILDEPVARLDPLARHDVMGTLMAVVAEEGISVLLSSHVVAELERVCDYLVVMSAGGVQVAGVVDELLAEHRVLTGPLADAAAVRAQAPVVREWTSGHQATLLVRKPVLAHLSAEWHSAPTSMEELVLSYLRATDQHALPGPASTPVGAET